MNWIAWHQGYDLSPSRQARLRLVQEQIRDCLTGTPAGAILYIAPDFDAALDDFKDYM